MLALRSSARSEEVDLNFWKKDQEQVEQPETQYQYGSENQEPEVVHSPEYFKPEPPDMEKARFYGNISRWILYIGVFLLPLFFLPWTTGTLELNKQILLIIVAGAGMVAWLLGVVSSGSLAWRNSYLDRGVFGPAWSKTPMEPAAFFSCTPASALSTPATA